MFGLRLYANVACCTALIVPLVACAGCWEKIEYKGPRTTSSSTQQSLPSNEGTSPSDSPPLAENTVASASATPAVEPPSPPPPSPPDTTSTPTTDDRYGTQAVTETAPPVAPPSEEASTNVPGIISAPSEPAPPADPPRHVDATPASATATDTPPRPALDSRRAAWLLGSRLSLAALANDRGVATTSVPIWFADARAAAKFLGTTIDDLPEPASAGDSSPASRRVIDYLATANGQRIGRELSKSHSREESALFEVALKSNILLLLYTPDSTAGNSIAAAISQAAPQAKLPAELWQPLVDALNKQSPQADVRAAVKKLHVDVDQYLSQPAEPQG